MNNDSQLVVLGETNFRNQRWRFGIKPDDRRRHMYVVGSTGMGKSEFLKNMAIQDIEAGRGIAFLDPHGDSADDLLDHIPAERVGDVVYFDPGDLNFPIAFNVMEKIEYEFRHLVASGLLGVFKKIFGVEVWSGRMEYILNNTILALLEFPDATLLGINKMLSNKEYRQTVVDNVKDPIVRSFWVDEFAKYTDRYMQEATPAIQNKIGQFISNNLIRNIIGQVHSTIDIRRIMDEGKILIVNLSRGKIGEDASRLLGALLVTKIQLAAMSRVDIPEPKRRDFYLYVDEFQHFATESFASILSEARKYHLSLVIAHQYIKQMEEPVCDAVFGNVGTIVSFRVGAEDGEFLEKWFMPDFLMGDIVNLGKYNIYLKLMIDGVSSKGFSAATIPPFPKLEKSYREEVLSFSRKTYATSREEVEKKIAEWVGMTGTEPARQPRGFGGGAPPMSAGGQASPRAGGGFGQDGPRYSQRYAERQFDNHPPRQELRQNQPHPRFDEKPLKPQAQTRQEPAAFSRTGPPINVKSPASQPQFPEQEKPKSFNSDRGGPVFRDQNDRPDHPLSLEPKPKFESRIGSVPRGVPLNEALNRGPVNFRGRRIDDKRERPKVEVNTEDLKKALEEAMRTSN